MRFRGKCWRRSLHLARKKDNSKINSSRAGSPFVARWRLRIQSFPEFARVNLLSFTVTEENDFRDFGWSLLRGSLNTGVTVVLLRAIIIRSKYLSVFDWL